MDTAFVKKTLLATGNVNKLYSILGGALMKAPDTVAVYTMDPFGNRIRLTIHRWNQHTAPEYKVLEHKVLSEECLQKGGFAIRYFDRDRLDTFSYSVTIKWGKKLPYLDLEPYNLRQSSRSMEMGIHDWFERVLGDYLRPVRRCLRVKEELVARVWHPDRVLRLLEAGIDEEDM